MNECIFCKIVQGEIPAKVVHREEGLLAFFDINPRAPVHVLIIPEKHLESVEKATKEDRELLGQLILTAGKIAKYLKVDQTGYRLVINNGKNAGQIVPHLHVHLMGGKTLP